MLKVPWNLVYENPEMMAREKYLDNFERILFTLVHGCQMFMTINGQVGIIGADCHIAVNDRICMLGGEAIPYVLRELPAPPMNMFRVMGPCYIEEYMGTSSRSFVVTDVVIA